MKVVVFKLFGREVARVESWEEATLSDMVSAMLFVRRGGGRDGGDGDGDECGEEIDPRQREVDRRFEDLTDRIVWDGCFGDDE